MYPEVSLCNPLYTEELRVAMVQMAGFCFLESWAKIKYKFNKGKFNFIF
jgi:hypothetical protein